MIEAVIEKFCCLQFSQLMPLAGPAVKQEAKCVHIAATSFMFALLGKVALIRSIRYHDPSFRRR